MVANLVGLKRPDVVWRGVRSDAKRIYRCHSLFFAKSSHSRVNPLASRLVSRSDVQQNTPKDNRLSASD